MKTPAASSRHLSAFALDIDYHLDQTGLFSRIRIKKTGFSQCSLVVVCSLANSSSTKTEIAQALEKVWIESPLGYSGGQNSYRVNIITTEVQMNFSTTTDEASVAGRIEVVGFK